MQIESPDAVPLSRSAAWENRRNNFDALRLLLALLVLASHCYPLGTGSEANEPIARWTHGQLTGGAIAVDLFFVMSGLMIAASMERAKSAGDFLKRRVTRIYPAFVVCALLSFIVVAPLSQAELLPSIGVRLADFALQTLRLREYTYSAAFAMNPYPGQAINGSIWSIQYEFWCYIGVLLLGLTGLLRRRWVVLGAFAASVVVSVFFLTQGWQPGGKFLGVLMGPPSFWARLLPYYLAGVVFHLFRKSIPYRGSIAFAAAILLVIATQMPYGVAVAFPIAGTYLCFYLAFAEWLPLHQAGRFGDFSYGLYLYAFPVQQLVMLWIGHAVTPARLFFSALPPTLLLGMMSWFAVERRFLRPGRRHQLPI